VDSPEHDYKVFAHLLDEAGALVAQRDSEPVEGSRPTSTWDPGEEVLDRHGILIPDGLAPGEYRLVVGMYWPSTGETLSPSGEGVQLVDGGVLLCRVLVTDE
jgi:hypothetical protein